MQPIIIWILLLVTFLIEIILLRLALAKQRGGQIKTVGASVSTRLAFYNLVLLLLLFIGICLTVTYPAPAATPSQPASQPAIILTILIVFSLIYLMFLFLLVIQNLTQPDEECSSARQAEKISWLRRIWVLGAVVNGLLLFGLGLRLTDNLAATPILPGAFVNMLARPLTQVVLVLLALLGIYPLIYIAYRQVYSKVHQTRLGEDFQLLGIYTENEAQSKAEELYNIVYSNRQYIWFITLILLFSILILVVYGFIDQLKAVDLSKIGLDKTVRSLVFYAYLGAYVFSIQELVRRYNTEDLRPQVFSSILGRMLVATVVVYVGARILLIIQPPDAGALTTAQPVVSATIIANQSAAAEPEVSSTSQPLEAEEITGETLLQVIPEPGAAAGSEASTTAEPGGSQEAAQTQAPVGTTCAMTDPCSNPPWWAAVLAFFIGIFPKSGIQWLQNLARNSINTLPAEVNALPVRNLQGISSLHEARLEEMGIDDVQNLATVDIRKLLLITRFDTQEIINWIDQAILYAKVGNKYERFRDQGILTFHQLVQRLKPEGAGDPSQKTDDNSVEGQTVPENEANAANEPPDQPAAQSSQNSKLHELALSLNVTDETLKFLSNESDYPNYAFIKQYYLYTPQLAKERASRGRSRLSTIQREGEGEDLDVNERLLQERDELLAVLEQDPCDADALNNLGLTQFKLGENKEDWKKAYNTLSKATAIDPNSTDKFTNLAGVCLYLEDWDKAIQNASRAIELDPTNKVAYYYLGKAYASKDFNAMAETKFNKALDLDDHYGEVYSERGKLYNKIAAYQKAINDFKVAYWLIKKGENIKFWFDWGVAYLERGIEIEAEQPDQVPYYYKNAVEKFSEAIARAADPKYFGLRGLAHYKLGQLEPAIQDFTRSIELLDKKAPERIKYQFHLALALWEAQKIDQACEMFLLLKETAQPNSYYAVQAGIYLRKTECAGALPPAPQQQEAQTSPPLDNNAAPSKEAGDEPTQDATP
jgi:tetratricopeptide (TPR) repeat protein